MFRFRTSNSMTKYLPNCNILNSDFQRSKRLELCLNTIKFGQNYRPSAGLVKYCKNSLHTAHLLYIGCSSFLKQDALVTEVILQGKGQPRKQCKKKKIISGMTVFSVFVLLQSDYNFLLRQYFPFYVSVSLCFATKFEVVKHWKKLTNKNGKIGWTLLHTTRGLLRIFIKHVFEKDKFCINGVVEKQK